MTWHSPWDEGTRERRGRPGLRDDRRRGAGEGRGRGRRRGEPEDPTAEGTEDDPRERRRHERRGGRGFGRPGGWQNVDLPLADDAQAWFEGRLPDGWFSDVEVSVDREEILVIGTLPDDTTDDTAAAEGRISRFRADTRSTRMQIADEAQARYRRKVSWGAELGDVRTLFTHISVPVMTRLRQPERQVLDTLVDAGVARSRSEALAWAVKLVGEHTESWLSGLRDAMAEVDKLRATGPKLDRDDDSDD
ncbi:hypothetical protein [Microlunatus parietis]|uniref:Uncharacterized protein n=1 Tax=Microlunatus parietis TaxID=682979 RepID=A0A7Y9I982_9ACTN|nr:hypothetical protein [Microlunatus parietis]NYE72575.1 hypothetical protein [Microlunatus parietis]